MKIYLKNCLEKLVQQNAISDLPEPDTKKGTVKPEVDKKEPNGH